MDCKEFEEHIDDYFSDPDFDWRLREEIDDHYFSCKKCYETYQIARFMADESLKKESLKELIKLQMDEAMSLEKEGKLEEAFQLLEEARELNPGDDRIVQFIKSSNFLLPKLFIDGDEISTNWEKGNWIASISKPCKIIIEFLGQKVFSKYFSDTDIFLSQNTVVTLQEKEIKPLEFKTDKLMIKIFKSSSAAKISINLR